MLKNVPISNGNQEIPAGMAVSLFWGWLRLGSFCFIGGDLFESECSVGVWVPCFIGGQAILCLE